MEVVENLGSICNQIIQKYKTYKSSIKGDFRDV